MAIRKTFSKRIDIESILKLEKIDRKAYEDSLKIYRDLKNVMDTSFELGIEKGIELGIELGELKILKKYAINLFNNGIPVNIIAKSFEVTETEVYKILKAAGLITEHGSH